MSYSEGFKARMVQRMTGPAAISATALASEVGVSQPTLSRWLKRARTVGAMMSDHDDTAPKSPRQWSAKERRQVVSEAATLTDAQLGAFLRGKGIHMAQLEQWREEARSAPSTPASRPKKNRSGKRTAEERRIRELERKLERTEKKLRAANALLDLQKKVREIWGGADESTPSKSES